MRIKVSPFLVGVFVLGAGVLLVLGLVSFGSLALFSDKQEFAVLFDESVSGLTPGAAVKMRGVDVGEVGGLDVSCNLRTQKSLVIARCKIDLDAISDHQGDPLDSSEEDAFRELIDKGLRAKLNLTGITGLLFVELDFYDPESHPVERPEGWDPVPRDMIVIPSVPSTITQISQTLSEVLPELEEIDFGRIGGQVEALLETLNRQLGEVELQELAASLSRAADALAGLAGSPEAKNVLVGVEETIAEARSLLERIGAKAEPALEEVGKTLEEAQSALVSFQDAARSLGRFFGSERRVGEDLSRMLKELADAAAAVRRLADYLQRNPGALISGRKGPGSR